jgi:hypothetical protein
VLTLLLLSCSGAPVEQPVVAPAPPLPDIAPLRLRATGPGRLHHEQSGPDWDTPNRSIGDDVFRLEGGRLDPDRQLTGGTHGAIAALAGSTLTLDLELAEPVPVQALLVPRGEGEPQSLQLGQGPVELSLPPRVGVWDLELTVQPGPEQLSLSFPVVTTWAPAIEGTPLYEPMLIWSGTWLEGMPARSETPPDELEAAEDRIALATLRGIEGLGQQGQRSYGVFKRPKDKDNQAHVWLDNPQSACGEYRGGYMALVEQHGVDAQWVMMSFRDPSPEKLSMYETREIAAVGTEPKVWQHWNHVAVEVNGQLYDPTYALHHATWGDYEDDLFERYCYGESDKCKTPGGWCQQERPPGSCVDNPPGYDPDDPAMGMKVWRGDDY